MRVKKVAAYQYTMTVASSQACNQTLYAAWKNETGFDESVYQGERVPRCAVCERQLMNAAGSRLVLGHT